MTHSSTTNANSASRTFGEGYLFGVPLGDMGWFGSLLIGVAAGFMTFFAATFVSIIFILVYNSTMHGNLDFGMSYRRVGLPAGLLVMAFALIYLGRLWVKRILRRS